MTFYTILNQIRKVKETNITSVVESVSGDTIEGLFGSIRQRKRVYHALPLIQLYLTQVAERSTDKNVVAKGINQGWLPITTSPRASSYCTAKSGLPEDAIKELAMRTGRSVEQCAKERWMFAGRVVKVVDGTSVQLPDTPSNQRKYPQPVAQKAGCGFPVMNMCVLMGLESGGIIDVETTAGTGHEHPMFRKLWRSLNRGDIVLGDACYGSYAEVALLSKMGVDGVFRKGTKKFEFENCVKLDDGDSLYLWKRPSSPGKWIDPHELPELIFVRVIQVAVGRKGFRSRNITIYTTLLDTDKYTASDLCELYMRRWDIELRFRDIKTTMGFEILRSKTPADRKSVV